MRRYAGNNIILGSVLYTWQTSGNSVYRDHPICVHSFILQRSTLDSSQTVSSFVSFMYVSKINLLSAV
jgi:hypothetical protein